MVAETALITGASSGIGWELAKVFAEHGSNLVLVARREEALQKLAAQLRAEHDVQVQVIPQDLSQCSAPQQIFDRVDAAETRIDILVNNAGFGDVGTVAALPLAAQLDAIRVNVVALAALSRLFLPGMMERKKGGILNVGSTAGFQPGPGMAVYFATKAFVLSFSEALFEELRGTGITVTCLAPGMTRTPFLPRAGLTRVRLGRVGALDARDVALAGYRGLRRGRALVVPGIGNKVLAAAVRFTPRPVVRKIAHWLNSHGS